MNHGNVDLSNALTFRQQWASGRRWVHEAWALFKQNPSIWLAMALPAALVSLLSSTTLGFAIQALVQILTTSLFVMAAAQWQQNSTLSWASLKTEWRNSGAKIFGLALISVAIAALGNLLINSAIYGAFSHYTPDPAHLGYSGMVMLVLIGAINAAIFSFSPARVVLNQQSPGAAIISSMTTFCANLPAILGAFFALFFWLILYCLLGLMLGWMLSQLLAAVLPNLRLVVQPVLTMLFILPAIAIAGLMAYTSWRSLFGSQVNMEDHIAALQG
jgi:hypothetical protein